MCSCHSTQDFVAVLFIIWSVICNLYRVKVSSRVSRCRDLKWYRFRLPPVSRPYNRYITYTCEHHYIKILTYCYLYVHIIHRYTDRPTSCVHYSQRGKFIFYPGPCFIYFGVVFPSMDMCMLIILAAPTKEYVHYQDFNHLSTHKSQYSITQCDNEQLSFHIYIHLRANCQTMLA